MGASQKPRVSDEDFIAAWKRFGNPTEVAQHFGMTIRAVFQRRKNLEQKGNDLPTFNSLGKRVETTQTVIPENRRIVTHQVKDGHVFIASDCHYWPGESTVAHQAFVKLIAEFKPRTIVLNGDVFDGARISRHEPLYGERPPTVREEIEACQDRLDEIAKASKNARKFWTFGNHDVRLHRYLAVNAPELSTAMNLFEYFPGWTTSWALEINSSTIIKHRWHNGIHASYNNTLKAGRSIVTGHLHRLMYTPWSDYNGRRYGIDTGTLAEPGGPQFTYLEANPTPWASGFVVLTYRDGQMLPPEFCEVLGGVAYFRGEPI